MKKDNEYLDCVALKHHIQEQFYEEFKPVSNQDYFNKMRKKIAKCQLWQEAIKKNKLRV